MIRLCLVTTILFVLALSVSQARTTSVDGRGHETGYCSYNQGSYCLTGIKSRAEREAQRDARWNCESQRGRPAYSAYCNSRCTPSFLSPNDTNILVRCDSNCRQQCEIEN